MISDSTERSAGKNSPNPDEPPRQNLPKQEINLEGKEPLFSARKRIDLKGTPPYFILHSGCLAVIFVGWSWFAVGAAVLVYLLRTFALTAFYHRHFSHRAFKTSRFMQFLFAALGNTAFQRGPLWWAANHRHHTSTQTMWKTGTRRGNSVSSGLTSAG